MNPAVYPLGHSSGEVGRLEYQAKLFHDPLLDELARSASHVLELGAGVGSNWPILRAASPRIRYLGIEVSEQAVREARANHAGGTARFEVMDATELKIPDKTYDLVLSKLVLWSIGPAWEQALRESYRVLKPGGVFYAFEPFDGGVLFHPPKASAQRLIQEWDQAALARGLNPLIGPKLPAALRGAGFTEVAAKPFPVMATAFDRGRYFAICDNFRKFYLGDADENPGQALDRTLKEQALQELTALSVDALVMDFFFVSWGYKPEELVQ